MGGTAREIVQHVSNVSDLNKQKVQLFVEAVVNRGQLGIVGDLVAADYVGHFPCLDMPVTGPERLRELVSSQRRANPGLCVEIRDQIAEEDCVVTRWQAHSAPAAGPDSARTPSALFWTGISIVRLLAGKQVDSHTECTNLTANPAGLESQS
jgi:hypothetical protein